MNGNNNTIYFNSFSVENIPTSLILEIKFIGNKNTTTTIYSMQGYHLIMCG